MRPGSPRNRRTCSLGSQELQERVPKKKKARRVPMNRPTMYRHKRCVKFMVQRWASRHRNFSPMLRTQGLRYRYADDGPELAFSDLDVGRGKELLLLGASGTGKTTLLHLIAGMRTPDGGRRPPRRPAFSALPTAERDVARGQHMGIVFQTAHFVRSLTVSENLALAQTLAGLESRRGPHRIPAHRSRTLHKLNARVDALSVGEQQRVSIARAVVHGPGIILADEPTSALDDTNTDAVLDLLRQQASDSGAALLIVTHDQRLKDRMADRVELTLNPTAE